MFDVNLTAAGSSLLTLFIRVPGRSILRTSDLSDSQRLGSSLRRVFVLCWSKCEVGLGEARVYLPDLNELRLCRSHSRFQLLLKLRVVQHVLKVISGVPHVEDYNAIVDRKNGPNCVLPLAYCMRLYGSVGAQPGVTFRRGASGCVF